MKARRSTVHELLGLELSNCPMWITWLDQGIMTFSFPLYRPEHLFLSPIQLFEGNIGPCRGGRSIRAPPRT